MVNLLEAISRMEERALITQREEWKKGKPEYPEVNFKNMVRHGWRKNELIHACVLMKAETAAQVEMVVKSKSDDEIIDDHPLKELVKNPNEKMDEYDLWKSFWIYQDLGGRAAYEIVRSNGGMPVELWPLRPDWVNPVPDKESFIKHYTYGPMGSDKVIIKTRDVVDAVVFDPLNFYNGYPPVAVAARTGDTDNTITDFIKAYFEGGGVPPGIITTTQAIKDATVERLRALWRERYGGTKNWEEPAILHSGATYEKVGSSLDEMGFEFIDDRDESRICAVLRVPPVIAGTRLGLNRSTLANYGESRLHWWEDTLFALYRDLLATINRQLVPQFGDDIYVDWDFSRVPAIKARRQEANEKALEAFKAAAITRNEYREIVGMPDLGPEGDVYIMSMTQTEVPQRSSAKTGQRKSASETKADPPENAPDHEERVESEAELLGLSKKYLGEQLESIHDKVAKEYPERV
jgi:HK97 family phage portal protein